MYGLCAPSSPEPNIRETIFGYSQGAPMVFKGDLYYYSVEYNAEPYVDGIDTTRCPLYLLTGEYDFATGPDDTRALADFFGSSYKVGDRDGRLVEMLLFAGVVYFVLCFALSRLVQALQKPKAQH